MNGVHFNHWTQMDRIMLSKARTFKELANLAISIIMRMPEGIEMVSGPISTGGVGSIDGNRKVFEGVVEKLIVESKLNVFSQMPFEDKMVELYLAWHKAHPKEKYCTPILEDFYEGIFSSGRVVVLHFIHGWESSQGARWEHDNCVRWKIGKKYLPGELSQSVLKL